MRKCYQSTYTGNDELHVYRTGDTTYSVVHLQEWEELDSSAVETHGKYNVVTHAVDVLGFDAYKAQSACGASVHDSLRSCGYVLDGHAEGCFDLGLRQILVEYDGSEVAAFGDPKACAYVIVEAMYGYGAGDRVFDESGNNKRILLRDARRYV